MGLSVVSIQMHIKFWSVLFPAALANISYLWHGAPPHFPAPKRGNVPNLLAFLKDQGKAPPAVTQDRQVPFLFKRSFDFGDDQAVDEWVDSICNLANEQNIPEITKFC